MAPLSLPRFLLWTLLSASIAEVTGSPVGAARTQYTRDALRKRDKLNVIRTTTTDSTTIDWVPIDSQGVIASPPPSIPSAAAASNASQPTAELQKPGAEHGPPGTVPIPRAEPDYLNNVAEKSLPRLGASKSKRQYAGNHWYVSSNQAVDNGGGKATFSVFDAFVANSGDFSLLQTAVTKSDTNGGQTLEAGWINYPDQVAQPHLFTFYTTNGYSEGGDNLGGWNQDVAGWVQTDTEIFPGTVFTPNSVDGGAQYEMDIQYRLYEDNWWLWVLDRWIGYYPASLFSTNISGVTLATGSDEIFYYGEIYQSEGPLTTTDMGSGEFASTGFNHSAYIHNMYYINVSASAFYDYTADFWDSDSTRYSHVNSVSSGTSWSSYVYLGGPGAGGVVGG